MDTDAFAIVKKILETDPPYNAHVKVEFRDGGNGFCANPIPKDLMAMFDSHSERVFAFPVCFGGSGGSVPFVSFLQSKLPDTLLLVSGASLPDSYIHGPNENLDLDYLTKFCKTLASILADYATKPSHIRCKSE